MFALGLQDAESGEYIIFNAILSLPPLASLTAMLVLTMIIIVIGLGTIYALGYFAVVILAVATGKKKVKWSDLLPLWWFMAIAAVTAVTFTLLA